MRRNRIDPEYSARFAREWFSAWNGHDLEKILAHYDDSVEFFSPFVTRILNDPEGRIRGKARLLEYFAQGLAHYPELKFVPLHILTGVHCVTLVYRSINELIPAETMTFGPEGLVTHVTAAYSL